MGNFLRNRYSDLVPASYQRKDIYVRSTDRDRTLESAVANLGAFYNVSSPGYVPFPVHTMPVESDNLLRFPNDRCKKYGKIKKELVATAEMARLNDEFRDDLARMARLVNSTVEYTIETMWPIMDTIDCHIANNYTGNRNQDTQGWKSMYRIV